MEHFIQFVINHWILWLALVAIVVMLIVEETSANIKGVNKINTQQATDLINHENALVVDVREEIEFKEGHIISSMNIPFNGFENNINKLIKYKNKPIILVDNNGQISIKAGAILRKQEFEKLYTLTGGIIGWKRGGLPLMK